MREVFYIHGSKSSIDLDVMVVIPYSDSSPKELHVMCNSYEEELQLLYPADDINVNLITIQDGRVVWCFKGTVDEVNNGLLDTYGLHTQPYKLTVRDRYLRNFELKAIRGIRTILSFLSRTEFREMVKESLKGDIPHKLRVLDCIDLSKINDLGTKKNDFKDYLKTAAFQMGQIIGLYKNKELYTKEDIAKVVPLLSPFLFREDNADLFILEQHKSLIVGILSKRNWDITYERSQERD